MLSDVVQDAIKFLDSVSDNYPGGIALKARLKKEASKQQNKVNTAQGAKLIFACLAGADFPQSPEYALAQAAIEKGLKKTPDDVVIISAPTLDQLKRKILDFIRVTPAYCAVLLGSDCWNVFDPADIIQSGKWLEYNGLVLLTTVGLSESLQNKDAKKSFWNDLKTLMLRFS